MSNKNTSQQHGYSVHMCLEVGPVTKREWTFFRYLLIYLCM